MPAPMIVGGTFRVEKKLGEGSFGAVYLGINVVTLAEVAIKLEAKKTPAECSTLEQERLIYRALADTTATPHIHWYGPTRKYNALVMDRLGRSLEDLFNQCGRKFSLKTVLMLADQIISQLEVIHTRHIIHRDIKPDNFIMGHEESSNRVFVVDFGMSKYYCHPKTRKHNKMITGKAFCGTARYASINAHMGLEQGRRDDLEAVGYVLLYFLRGGLPWQGIKIKDATERYAETGRRKLATSSSSLCSGLPKEFTTYLDLTRKLRFEDRPNYKAYRKMFMDLYAREGYMEDDIFDWTTAHAPKSGKSTANAVAALGNGSSAKHEPPAAKPKDKVKVKMKPEDGLVELVQRVDLVRPHEELGPVKSGVAVGKKVVSKAKPVPEKPTANVPEPKPRPKVLNKIAIATKPTPALAKTKAMASAADPGPVKSPPHLVAKAEPKAKLASKPTPCNVERIPVCQSPAPSPPSPRQDMDEVLEKIEALKISDERPPMQRGTKESNPRHLNSGNWKAQAQKYTPPPPLARHTAVTQPGPQQAALRLQPAKPVPAVKEPLSQEVTEISSDSDVAKPAKPGAVPTRRAPLRMRNVNTKPPAALIHSSPRRRKNPPRLATVNTNAKSPLRRRMVVTRAVAGRKGV